MLASLLSTCGSTKRQHFLYQEHVVRLLENVAEKVKGEMMSNRQTVLMRELQCVSTELEDAFSLPLNAGMEVAGLNVSSCSYFSSNTVPLSLVFFNSDMFGDDIRGIFKIGDDLRQDALVIQMIRIMDKLWIRDGLDLRIVTYDCMPTGKDAGMLEMVSESETLRKIQTLHGLTGSFKDRPLADWLMRYNTTDLDYRRAVDNFTLSCAGYCVATYVLGICDRHNDNIMICKTGHLFHIDFAKILGNSQMFGAIRRDRVPFVLTPDMAYVINGGDRQSRKFHQFVDVCCHAFNLLRKHRSLFVNLFALMLSSGIPGLSQIEDVSYIHEALLPNVSDTEATQSFTQFIEESLGSLSTQLNFFIHNLAQMRFSGHSESPSLLSFAHDTFSLEIDGKIASAEVTGFEKRYQPAKFYVYIITVRRDGSKGNSVSVYRRYSEFHELHSKLCEQFPEQVLPPFPSKIYVGRSHTRQVAERREKELNNYLQSIFQMKESIAESHILYTFLHCFLRDEQDAAAGHSELTLHHGDCLVAGEVKLCLSYNKDKSQLTAVVKHARDLVSSNENSLANPYVKLYLLPDSSKSTKRKTKVVRKSLNPTYNESVHVDYSSQICRMMFWLFFLVYLSTEKRIIDREDPAVLSLEL
ncbi:phosphatidylinositol 4-phosphate 3-kinase C2 domain-containing subunit alpha-like isoform X2 [Corticium candelabrum]|uniref:phosphatidylinositol 4-phosphate 3-kinase C2 domain-containing subunit alpha-like isoform X2 n=1 Tax=Corticium candelabrum TaxID=121492 RepID=UPI002E264329|nr:phosphatidylinositol 4-phosphate 3-kinase C2 domain-containing subunit alpha-like isoform X2 [Corticium candelabrum]